MTWMSSSPMRIELSSWIVVRKSPKEPPIRFAKTPVYEQSIWAVRPNNQIPRRLRPCCLSIIISRKLTVTMLRVDSINTFYGKAQIIFDLSLEISAGEVVVLLGRNGAGKTTTFKSIMGLVPATSGAIIFNTENILGRPPHKICGLGLGYVPEDRRIFSRLTILENLEVARQPARKGIEP